MENFILSDFTQELVQLTNHIKNKQREFEINFEEKKTQETLENSRESNEGV